MALHHSAATRQATADDGAVASSELVALLKLLRIPPMAQDALAAAPQRALTQIRAKVRQDARLGGGRHRLLSGLSRPM